MRGQDWREATTKPTDHHAQAVHGENRQFADWLNGVYYFDELVVLKTAFQPAVLLESGIIVNRADELKLQAAETRNTIAVAVGEALNNCLRPEGDAENTDNHRLKNIGARSLNPGNR